MAELKVQGVTNLAGSTAHERKIWNSYLCTARQAVDAGTLADPLLEMSQSRARLPTAREDALQAIVFTAFALEYRIKRILDALGLAPRARDTLGPLVEQFRKKVEGRPRLNDGVPIQFPADWHRLEKRLLSLVTARNRVAHANASELQRVLSGRPRRVAARHFNALVHFIEVTNRITGYDDPLSPDRARYRQLRVRVP